VGRLRAGKWQGRILFVPARHHTAARLLDYAGGFMETVKPAGRRGARVAGGSRARSRSAHCLAITHVLHASQVHVTFRAALLQGKFGVGAESLQVGLYQEAEIPWEQIASRASSSRCAAISRIGAWHW